MMASDRVGIPDIPRIKEINASVIWEDIKNEEAIMDYFPEIFVSTNRVPNRDYMFRVILKDFFALLPDVYTKMLNHISTVKKTQLPEEEKIEFDPQILNTLKKKSKFSFESRLKREDSKETARNSQD